MSSARKKRHWGRVHKRWEAEVQRTMDIEADTVAGQSLDLPSHHPSHYEVVSAPPVASGAGGATAGTRRGTRGGEGWGGMSACTIQ